MLLAFNACKIIKKWSSRYYFHVRLIRLISLVLKYQIELLRKMNSNSEPKGDRCSLYVYVPKDIICHSARYFLKLMKYLAEYFNNLLVNLTYLHV